MHLQNPKTKPLSYNITHTQPIHTHTKKNPNPKTLHTTGSHALDEYVTRVTYSSNPQNPKFKSLPTSNVQTQHTHTQTPKP
jgi:hypothetical protein